MTRQFKDLFNKLARIERGFLEQEFLAPVVDRGVVHVRIAGIINRLQIEPPSFRGFGVFQPLSLSKATLVCEATLGQRRQYLELLPLVRLILCRREGKTWLAVPAHRIDSRFRIDGIVPVQMATKVQMFDRIRARFDGQNFWFEAIDTAQDLAKAHYLRQKLFERVPPNQLNRPGLTLEERMAYSTHFVEANSTRQTAQALESANPEIRLKQALAYAGAELVDFMEHSDGYRVSYRVGNERYVSSVCKNDLTVQVAGICLSGQDRKFDLSSLIGVLRESNGRVVRVGLGGIHEDVYWEVHPAPEL